MSTKRVCEHLKKFDLDSRILEMKSSTATVKEAAATLGVEEGMIAKTLSFYVDHEPILIVARGDSKIDNKKFKAVFGKHGGHMIPVDEVEAVIGHAAGGVCPFGINDGVKVYLDESLKDFKEVYPAAGSSNSCVRLSIEELEKTIDFESWIDVTK